jgi:hypothetical protein
MRIAGGVLFMIVGLWSLVSGGCSLLGGGAMKAGGAGMAKLQKEINKAAKSSGAKVNKRAMKNLKKASGMGTGLMVYGIVALLASILCIIAGIMLFLNKGKMLAFIAGGLGILGEVIFFAMITFSILGVIKIVLYGIGAAGGTGVKQN